MTAMLDRELDGIVAVSLEQAVAAPYCGLLLADAGARVIKIERPDGDFARLYDHGADGESVWFAWLNRGKESIAVDLNDPEDAALLRRLIGNADIFLHNLAPGALERRGFDGAALRAENAGLITCQLSGYGDRGTAARMKAYDTLVQAESGICSVTGTPEQPSRAGVSICDIATGLTAFSAILRALIQRGRTGTGLDLHISLFDVMADWMNMQMLVHRYLGRTPARTGLTHPVIAPYGPYGTADGQIMIAIQSNHEWRNFCETVLGRPELGTDPKFADNTARVENRAAMDEAINAVFSTKSRDELIVILRDHKIACARISSVEDLSNHEFLRQTEIHFGKADLMAADLPVLTAGPRPSRVPKLDEHGRAIRREFAAG
ncbi:CaiB/BaiF CoA-transferase family protein [Nitratireductor sp. XY-223]|uniref:CaiB/BaiF CoA transferase family protein n=1 Tax=Nitratireductor sp. XY-223 TaxID=2561926 RepID=UPI0010A9E4DF|nr:CaiB/BaiF CoA-transferase family protein [Nitratireductor sp. XY-223]